MKYQLSNWMYLLVFFDCVFSMMLEVLGTNSDEEEKN